MVVILLLVLCGIGLAGLYYLRKLYVTVFIANRVGDTSLDKNGLRDAVRTAEDEINEIG